VSDWQKAHGVAADGCIGPATLHAARAAAEAQPHAAAPQVTPAAPVA